MMAQVRVLLGRLPGGGEPDTQGQPLDTGRPIVAAMEIEQQLGSLIWAEARLCCGPGSPSSVCRANTH